MVQNLAMMVGCGVDSTVCEMLPGFRPFTHPAVFAYLFWEMLFVADPSPISLLYLAGPKKKLSKSQGSITASIKK